MLADDIMIGIKFATMKDPPLRVVIGTDAYKAVMNKLDTYEQNYKKWEEISNSTDAEGYKPPS